MVLEALRDAGLAPFSIAPSSALVAAAGEPAHFAAEPVALALRAGLLPVVYGDVVMDRERGCAICSTESALLALDQALERDRAGTASGSAARSGPAPRRASSTPPASPSRR